MATFAPSPATRHSSSELWDDEYSCGSEPVCASESVATGPNKPASAPASAASARAPAPTLPPLASHAPVCEPAPTRAPALAPESAPARHTDGLAALRAPSRWTFPRPFIVSLVWALRTAVGTVVGSGLIHLPMFTADNVAALAVLTPIFAILVTQATIGESLVYGCNVVLGTMEGAVVGSLWIIPFLYGGRVGGMVGFFLGVLLYSFLQRSPLRRSCALILMIVVQLPAIASDNSPSEFDWQLPLRILFSCLVGALVGVAMCLPFPSRAAATATLSLRSALHSSAVALDALVSVFLARTHDTLARVHLDRADQAIQSLESEVASAAARLGPAGALSPLLDPARCDAFGMDLAPLHPLLLLLGRIRVSLAYIREAVCEAPERAEYVEVFLPRIRDALVEAVYAARVSLQTASHMLELGGRTLHRTEMARRGVRELAAGVRRLYMDTQRARQALFFDTDANAALRSTVDGVHMHAMCHGLLRVLGVCVTIANLLGAELDSVSLVEGGNGPSSAMSDDGIAASPTGIASFAALAMYTADAQTELSGSTDLPPALTFCERVCAHVDLIRLPGVRACALVAVKFALALTLCALMAVVPALQAAFPLGIWAPITAAFVLQFSLADTFRRSMLRMEGTVLGAVYGHVCFRAVGDSTGWLLALLAVWSFGFSYFRSHAHFGYAALVASFTPVVVMFGNKGALSTGEYAFARCVQTFVGSFVVVVVSLVTGGLPWAGTRLNAAVVGTINESRLLILDLFDWLVPPLSGVGEGAMLLANATTDPHSTVYRARTGLLLNHMCGMPRTHVANAQANIRAQVAALQAVALEPQLWREAVPLAEATAMADTSRALVLCGEWVMSATDAIRHCSNSSAELALTAPLCRDLAILHGLFARTLRELAERSSVSTRGLSMNHADLQFEHQFSLQTACQNLYRAWGAALAVHVRDFRAQKLRSTEDVSPLAAVLAVSSLVFACERYGTALDRMWSAHLALEQAKRMRENL